VDLDERVGLVEGSAHDVAMGLDFGVRDAGLGIVVVRNADLLVGLQVRFGLEVR